MFEDIHLKNNPLLEKALGVMNFAFAIIFTVEMLLKILGMGFVGYFTNLWNCLDSFIVAVSCCSLHSTLSGDYLMFLFRVSFRFFYCHLFLVFYLRDWGLSSLSLFNVFASMRFQPARTAAVACRKRDGCFCRPSSHLFGWYKLN